MRALPLLLLLLALAPACRPGRPPAVGPDVGTPPDPATLLAQLRRQSEGRRNLRALGRVTMFGPEGRVRLQTVFVAERPRSFRFETLSPFEQPIDVMTSDGERLWLLSEGRLFEGPATSENVARLLPLPLRPEEVVEVFLGGVPVSERYRPVRVETADGRWRLVLEGPSGEEERLVVDPRSLRVLSAELEGADGQPRAAIEMSRFETAGDGGPAVPTEIEVRVPPRALDIRLRLRDPETDVDLPKGLFEMTPPPGTRPEPL